MRAWRYSMALHMALVSCDIGVKKQMRSVILPAGLLVTCSFRFQRLWEEGEMLCLASAMQAAET